MPKRHILRTVAGLRVYGNSDQFRRAITQRIALGRALHDELEGVRETMKVEGYSGSRSGSDLAFTLDFVMRLGPFVERFERWERQNVVLLQRHLSADSSKHYVVNWLFGFQRGVRVASRSQLGLPA